MAVILAAFVPQLIQSIYGFVEEDAVLRLGAVDALGALLKNLEMARDLLPDAESRSRSERAVHQWLKDLKEIVYDCDDLADHCKLEIDKCKLSPESRGLAAGLTAKCHLSWFSCFSRSAFRHEIGGRINTLSARLESVVKEAPKLQLQKSIGQAIDFGRRIDSSSTPLPDRSKIAGTQFEEDAKSLVKLLVKDDRRLFFAISGIGGIGKTTLARRIHDDERIKAHFHVRIWVSVSQQFTDINILKEIISGAGAVHGEARTREQLEHLARRSLQGKKFLLVLDDVCSNHVSENLLRCSTESNPAGSRILTTTRNEDVAMELPDVHLQRMKILPTGDGWSLLSEKVFHGDREEDEIGELRDVGFVIARKCKGLPLAIKTVAGVLRSNEHRSSQQWRSVLADPAWSSPELPDNIMRALYLGYQDLPSHLKQCFVYCSLFPDNHIFDKMPLLQCWIAEGLVEAKENARLEDTAESYYRELIWRNLLEPVDQGRANDRCKIHGLLRFLAYFVAAEEHSVGNLSSLSSSSSKTRRLSIASRCLASIPGEIRRQEALRTLFLFKNPVRMIADELFDGMRSLRVLDVHGTEIENLPSSIAVLQHLRLLNVSETRLRGLPENIEQLKNLQFLSVRGCELLETLPDSLVNLQKLRSLDIVGTRIDGMPIGIGRLENMNLLSGFVIRNGCESCTFELGAMSQLTSLTLHKLERVPNGKEAARARLVSKQHLKTLSLNWSRNIDGLNPQDNKFNDVFNELAPPANLQILEIKGFPGIKFPSWIPLLCELTHLVIQQCAFIRQLPQLGRLPVLRHLNFSGAAEIASIGPEFFGLDSCPAFPKLETLILEDLTSWEHWRWQAEDGEAFTSLSELQLVNCPKLRSLPEGLCNSKTLKVLSINGADFLAKIEDLPSVKELQVHHCSNLMQISNLLALESLNIKNCPSLKKISNLHTLQHLHLMDESIDRLPEGLGKETMKQLQWFEMECGEELLRKCLVVHGSEWHKLRQIPEVHIRSKDLETPWIYWDKIHQPEETAIATVLDPAASVQATPMAINRLLVILGSSLILSALLDCLLPSPSTQLVPAGASLVTTLVDAVSVLIVVPLGVARDFFGFLSITSYKTYQLIDRMEDGVNFLCFFFEAVLESLLNHVFFSPSFLFLLVLFFLASCGGRFRHA